MYLLIYLHFQPCQKINKNNIDSLKTLNKFIGVINENKKCCEDLKNVKNETDKIEKEKNASNISIN